MLAKQLSKFWAILKEDKPCTKQDPFMYADDAILLASSHLVDIIWENTYNIPPGFYNRDGKGVTTIFGRNFKEVIATVEQARVVSIAKESLSKKEVEFVSICDAIDRVSDVRFKEGMNATITGNVPTEFYGRDIISFFDTLTAKQQEHVRWYYCEDNKLHMECEGFIHIIFHRIYDKPKKGTEND